MMNDISLYIHIPFCIKKCTYCAFFSLAGQNEEIMDAYSSAVVCQIKNVPKSRIKTIYFGGGTPTVIGANRLALILKAVFSSHQVCPDAEITLETNPKAVVYDDLIFLKNTGFNRLSLGLQSSDEKTLELLGRIHTKEDFNDAYYSSARAGFDNISVDIIFGLPGINSTATLDKTLEYTLALKPVHISAYSLSVEPGTPLYHDRKAFDFPDEDEEELQYKMICEAFSGYRHYEVSSFARNDMVSRHNSAYWSGKSYIGIGAGAHSFYNNKRFSCINDIGEYIRLCKQNSFLGPTDYNDSVMLSAEELYEESVMLGLRTDSGIIPDKNQLAAAEKYIKNGFAVFESDRLKLTSSGYRISNRIIRDLLI